MDWSLSPSNLHELVTGYPSAIVILILLLPLSLNLRQIFLEGQLHGDPVLILVQNKIGHQEPPLSAVRRCKLVFFGHVTQQDILSKTILQGTLEGNGAAVAKDLSTALPVSKQIHFVPSWMTGTSRVTA